MKEVRFQSVAPAIHTSRFAPSDPLSPVSNTRSSISSRCSCNCCVWIVSALQTVWNWFKEKILRMKKNVSAPVEAPHPPMLRQLARYEGNLVADFKADPEKIIRIKSENPKKFLEIFVEQALRDPMTFFTETLKRCFIFYYDGSERSDLIDFIQRAGPLLGTEGTLSNPDYTARHFPNDPTIKEHVQLINNYLSTEDNREKVNIMKDVYRQILGGDRAPA